MSDSKRNSMNSQPAYDLSRFLIAQKSVYANVVAELKNGRKQTHWMWYIFPQIIGLGYSRMAKHFAIKNIKEARSYFQHPILGARLTTCTEIVLATEGRTALQIFGHPDNLKLRSSMTLFACAAGKQNTVFTAVIDKYFASAFDQKTLHIIQDE